jgi:hypothetical protein
LEHSLTYISNDKSKVLKRQTHIRKQRKCIPIEKGIGIYCGIDVHFYIGLFEILPYAKNYFKLRINWVASEGKEETYQRFSLYQRI